MLPAEPKVDSTFRYSYRDTGILMDTESTAPLGLGLLARFVCDGARSLIVMLPLCLCGRNHHL